MWHVVAAAAAAALPTPAAGGRGGHMEMEGRHHLLSRKQEAGRHVPVGVLHGRRRRVSGLWAPGARATATATPPAVVPSAHHDAMHACM